MSEYRGPYADHRSRVVTPELTETRSQNADDRRYDACFGW
jgi:hypothetical protein